jgi:outer membrane protein assembly factor BamA
MSTVAAAGLTLWLALYAIAPQAPARALALSAVHVEGVRRYTPAEVARLSGLQVGTSVAVADFDTAVKRLAATGLFKTLNYRYLTTAGCRRGTRAEQSPRRSVMLTAKRA